MKKAALLLLALMISATAWSQLKLGTEFSASHLWMNAGHAFSNRSLVITPAVKAELGLGKRWTLTTGFRYTTTKQFSYGNPYYFCFPMPGSFGPPRVMSYVEIPLGIKYRINPSTSTKWSLSLTGAATVGKATSLSYSIVYLQDGIMQQATQMPWLFGAEMGAEASRSLGKHLTLDFAVRMKAMTTFHFDGFYGYQMLGPSVATGMGWKF